jgi:hypothetical protein
VSLSTRWIWDAYARAEKREKNVPVTFNIKPGPVLRPDDITDERWRGRPSLIINGVEYVERDWDETRSDMVAAAAEQAEELELARAELKEWRAAYPGSALQRQARAAWVNMFGEDRSFDGFWKALSKLRGEQ